jgi:cytochrome c oxidase assembly factor CtaG
VDTELTGHRPGPSRPWLTAAGAALIVACLVPPLGVLARRYLFVESIQFCVFALAAPVLFVLGATLRLGASGAGRPPPRGPDSELPDAAAGELPHERTGPLAGRYRPSFLPILAGLIAWVTICLVWRLPPVLDQLTRHPVLVTPEAATLCAAGIGLWLGLVGPRPMAQRLGLPRLSPLRRACAAAAAMWSIWAIAYVLGFAAGSVVHGYDGGGSHLMTVDDQEISAFVLWAAAAAAFLPIVFTAGLRWLKDGSEAPREPARGVPQVRGWGSRARLPAPGKGLSWAGPGEPRRRTATCWRC